MKAMCMKLKIKSGILVLAFLLITTACDKEVETQEPLVLLSPIQMDITAASWSPVLLNSPDQIAVPAPADVNSPAYQAELEAVRNAQRNLTARQREIVAFWSGGGVLRWNQLFRQLVARFNLPPAPAPDGRYPAPDAENPFGDPQFPFSNPPYASRAYSYASAAVYDALLAAWHYKYLYNRPAPHQQNAGVQSLMPPTDLPAYPSEEAVMSGAAAEVLKLMFPAALEEITKYAAEQRQAAVWSGKAVASDVAAGLALGKSVANLFIARARTDGMGASVGSPAQWAALSANATNRGDVAWVSLETPPRPPMLPFFGNVQPWKMTTADIVGMRPAPPSLAGSEAMKQQLERVKFYADNMTRERLRIVHYWADGVGTYTPPGHWNDIAAEYIRDARFSEVRAARALALLNMALHNAAIACWETKYFYFNARPSQLDPTIKTATGVPNFPAYVSGHSTFSASAATVLSYLFPAHRSRFEAQAEEAALSRLYGGIHYPEDCDVGLVLGRDVGQFIVTQFAMTDGAD